MANLFPALGKNLGKRLFKPPKPQAVHPKGVKLRLPRSLNYARIKEEVMREIARLSPEQQAQLPMAGTLPELMVAYGLLQLGYLFTCQTMEMGGRMRLGGGVVDTKVYLGATTVVVRVQGDYWHSLPDRKLKDEVQWARLHAMGYRVADFWENAVYTAWVERRLVEFVDEGIQGAE